MTDAGTQGWDGVLHDDESIIWQGRPEPGIAFKPSHVFTILFGLVFSGFALFWMIMASQAGGFFWMFGLIHFTAGFCVMFGPIVGPAYRRNKTWYTLTTDRAFVADITVFGRKRLKSYPILPQTPIETEVGTFTSIHFASETRRRKNRTYTVPIGFERLRDGETVSKLIRDMQKDNT